MAAIPTVANSAGMKCSPTGRSSSADWAADGASGKAATSYGQSVPGHDAEPGHIGMDYLNEGRRKAKK